uniref:P/Homo B domain-containing protein n=1 Tax=Strigamia maritima TaxID=126957 RepID=T1IUB0_STRMM
QLEDLNETETREWANQRGFRCLIRLFEEENIYDFIHPNLSKCLECPSERHINILKNHPKVKWVEQQAYRVQIIRRVIHDKQMEMPTMMKPRHNSEYVRVPVDSAKIKKNTIPQPPLQVTFNDPFYKDQWYLHNEGQTGAPPGNDLNVVPVWKAGFTGKGVTLCVLDDGLQHTNPDLHGNYEASVSYNLVDFESTQSDWKDPMPDGRPENNHGTYCAGVIAAVSNNNFCGIGVAFCAKVGGIRVLDGPVTDMQEALALSLGLGKVDIYSASWGPEDDGKHVAGPGLLASTAFVKGINKYKKKKLIIYSFCAQGRGGRGAIYVWAVGNGGSNSDNCNLDGYVSNIYTLAVSALTEDGLSAYYSEPCASTMASTFVGGPHSIPSLSSRAIKDIHKIKVVVPELDGECMESFEGTSAAAPLAAGMIALVLEANPNLTWRDVQHIVVETARVPTSAETGWQVNGAGYHFHFMFGFGVMDAARMVFLAQKWRMVAPMVTWTIKLDGAISKIEADANTTVTFDISEPPAATGVISHLEYVEFKLYVQHRCRGNLEIFFISPSGTESQVLTRRPRDCSDEGFDQWPFTSVHFWGENPEGKWTVRVRDHTKNQTSTEISVLKVPVVTFKGTNDPWLLNHFFDPIFMGKAYKPNATQLSELVTVEKRLKTLQVPSKKERKSATTNTDEVSDSSSSSDSSGGEPLNDILDGIELMINRAEGKVKLRNGQTNEFPEWLEDEGGVLEQAA